jgi:hypothetical protein
MDVQRGGFCDYNHDFSTEKGKPWYFAMMYISTASPKIASIKLHVLIEDHELSSRTKNQPCWSVQCRAMDVQTVGDCDYNHDFSTEKGK